MKNLVFALLIILSVLISSCSTTDYNKVDYTIEDTTYIYGNCDSLEIGCVEISLSFLTLHDDKYKELNDSVNGAVKEFLYSSPFSEEGDLTFDALKNSIVDDYKKIKEDFPDSPVRYSYDREITISTDTLNVFSLAFRGSDYFGGAHPNSFFGFANFDKTSGKEILLSQLLIDNYQNELDKAGEKIFRQIKGLSPSQNLNVAGYWFDNNKFILNNNFLIAKTGLRFLFNQYEIAPYAEGITIIEIPYSEITGIIKKNGILSKLIRK